MKEPERRFELLDHTADSGLRIFGDSLPRLFENAAFGLLATVVEGLEEAAPEDGVELRLSAPSNEELLVDWLNDRLYRFEANEEIHAWPRVTSLGAGELASDSHYRRIDWERDTFHAEVKSATYHGLSLVETNGTWIAEVILDL